MSVREKWERLQNPQTVGDYGLSVNLDELLREDDTRAAMRLVLDGKKDDPIINIITCGRIVFIGEISTECLVWP